MAKFVLQKEIEKKDNKQKIIENARENLALEKARKISIKEGGFASVMSGTGDSFLTPFALALNANNMQIGFLSSISNLLSPLAQLKSSKLMEFYSRKKLVSTFVFIQAFVWLVYILLAFLFFKGRNVSWLVVLVYAFYALIGGLAGPAWFSWMGDIVPEKIRGRYLSRRNRICGAIALTTTLLASFFLDFFKTKGFVLLGFSILFAIATLSRLVSVYYFTKQHEPKIIIKKENYFSFFKFIKKAPYNNFGRFVFFVALMNFATAVAGPFFAVYMLKELNFNYIWYSLINIFASIASLISMPLWGKVADKYGSRELLRIGSVLIPFIPVLWLFSSSPLYLMLVPQLISGIGWAAFNLGVNNFTYDSVIREKRAFCVAYLNMVNGILVFLGATLGGFLIQHISIAIMNKFLFIFLVSGILRLVVSLAVFPKIKQPHFKKIEEKMPTTSFYFKEIARETMIEMIDGIGKMRKGIKKLGR